LARSLGQLAAEFGCELIGDPSVSVSGVATLSNAGAGHLSFFANKAYRDELRRTQAAAVLLRSADADDCPVAALIIDDPYLTYARIAAILHPEPAVVAGIHGSAVVSATAAVSLSAEISAHATISDDAMIGDDVLVGPGVVVGPRCRVGKGSRLLANATLVQDVTLGERCIVHPGAVVGADGFGHAMGEVGWVKVPQLGGVRIGNDVEIGANTTIDRGAIEDTVLEDGVRLDNLVQIAHNVHVGAHTAMAAFVGVSGSTIIGERCMLAGRVGVVGHANICDDVIVGGAAVVSKDITEPGFYSGSFMAEKDRDWKRRVAHFRRIGDLARRVKALERAADEDDD